MIISFNEELCKTAEQLYQFGIVSLSGSQLTLEGCRFESEIPPKASYSELSGFQLIDG